ncbi:unnamed protein product, partial [marine sediment metagenome]
MGEEDSKIIEERGGIVTDETLYTSPNDWLKIKKSKHHFYYVERKGKDSIAVFLVRLDAGGAWEVLIRYQPLPVWGNLDLYPCPITG